MHKPPLHEFQISRHEFRGFEFADDAEKTHVGNDGDQSVRRFSLHGAFFSVLSLEKCRQILPQTLSSGHSREPYAFFPR